MGKRNYPRRGGYLPLHCMAHPEFQRIGSGHRLTQPMAQNHIPPRFTHSHQEKVMICKLFLLIQIRSQVMIKIP